MVKPLLTDEERFPFGKPIAKQEAKCVDTASGRRLQKQIAEAQAAAKPQKRNADFMTGSYPMANVDDCEMIKKDQGLKKVGWNWVNPDEARFYYVVGNVVRSSVEHPAIKREPMEDYFPEWLKPPIKIRPGIVTNWAPVTMEVQKKSVINEGSKLQEKEWKFPKAWFEAVSNEAIEKEMVKGKVTALEQFVGQCEKKIKARATQNRQPMDLSDRGLELYELFTRKG